MVTLKNLVKESMFFFEKGTKELLLLGTRGPFRVGHGCQRAKVFCFFFQKRRPAFF
jgi:hypothetical protein